MGGETVDKDTLRAELLDLELRIVREMTKVVQPLSDSIAKMQRGEFNEAQRRAIAELADSQIEDQAGLKWTRTSRTLVVLGALVSFTAMLATVSVAITAVF